MPLLSSEGQALVNDVAARHGFSPDAVTHVLLAVDQGGRSQAQFNHFELGGMGQWSLGGMIMIGDMFNNGLKARVDSLCTELSNALSGTQVFQPAAPQPVSYQGQSQSGGQYQSQGTGMPGQSSLFVPGPDYGSWWPEDLGQPGSTGAQNDLKYAYFPMTARLAIMINGVVTVYDTGQHQIGGFGQQQGGDQSLTFTSQFGLVRVADLPIVSPVSSPVSPPMSSQVSEPEAYAPPESFAAPEPGFTSAPAPAPAAESSADSASIFEMLEKLGGLRDKGILSDAEFNEKKAELLARL